MSIWGDLAIAYPAQGVVVPVDAAKIILMKALPQNLWVNAMLDPPFLLALRGGGGSSRIPAEPLRGIGEGSRSAPRVRVRLASRRLTEKAPEMRLPRARRVRSRLGNGDAASNPVGSALVACRPRGFEGKECGGCW